MDANDPPIVALAAIQGEHLITIVDIDDTGGVSVLCRCNHDSPLIALLPQIAAACDLDFQGVIVVRSHTA